MGKTGWGAFRHMDKTEALPRTVGFWGAALLPVNGMIGAGIFALPALLVAAVGSFAPWMMLAGLLLVLPLALVFAALAGRFEAHGGPVLYVTTAFGPFFGFQAGWARYASGVVSVAANAHVAIAYSAVLFPVLADPLVKTLAAAGFIIAITGVNLVGMRASVGVLGAMTAGKLIPLAGLVVIGLASRDPAIGFELPRFTAAQSVILLTFYAYTSFENATFAAGEVRNARRTIPRAMVTTLSAVTAFYMLVIWAYLAVGTGADGPGENALAAAAAVVTGPAGAIAIAIAAVFSIAGNTLGGGIVIPRVTYGMAEQGLLPRIFAHVSPRLLTPDVSILFFGAVAVAFTLSAGFGALAAASTLARLAMYLLTALSLPVLDRESDEKAPAWHLPLAALAAATTVWVASQASQDAFVMIGAVLAAGCGLYLIARRSAAGAAQAA